MIGPAWRPPMYPTMPHIIVGRYSCESASLRFPAPASAVLILAPLGFHLLALLLGPAFLYLLGPFVVDQRACRDVVAHGRGGGDIDVVPDTDRRDQRGIAADLHPVADGGAVFLEAVVVAGDGAGAYVALAPDGDVAEVGEVIGLAALADGRLLGFDEVAYMDVSPEGSSRSQVGKGADQGAVLDPAIG